MGNSFLAQVTPSAPLGFPQGAIQKAPEHLGEVGIGAQQLLFAGAFRQAHFMRGPFQQAQPTTVICTCFLFAFWFSETLGCTWVPFANYSLQPGALDTLLLILPKWNLSFPHYNMNLERRALTKILNVMRHYKITLASTKVFWIGLPRHINLINMWV